MTTKDKLIEKQKEYIEAILKFKFVIPMSMYDKYESELKSLESELAKEQEPEGVTAEEIMIKYCSEGGLISIQLGKNIIKAMEAYKQINLKEELIKYIELILNHLLNDLDCSK